MSSTGRLQVCAAGLLGGIRWCFSATPVTALFRACPSWATNGVEGDLGVKTVWGVRAAGVERRGSGSVLHLSTTEGEVQTRNVVCAPGASAHPRIPTWVADLRVPGVVLHSSEYLYPRQVLTSDVLIVGGGNSGVQLARELAPSHAVTLAVRTPRRHQPAARYLRRQFLARGPRPEPVFEDSYEQLRDAGVRICPAVAKAGKSSVTFVDGTVTTPSSVILATGFDPGDDWLPDSARIDPPQRAMTGIPGLFVAGIPQYGGRGSDTIAGVPPLLTMSCSPPTPRHPRPYLAPRRRSPSPSRASYRRSRVPR